MMRKLFVSSSSAAAAEPAAPLDGESSSSDLQLWKRRRRRRRRRPAKVFWILAASLIMLSASSQAREIPQLASPEGLDDARAEKLVYAHAEDQASPDQNAQEESHRSRGGTDAEPRQLMNFRPPVRNLRKPPHALLPTRSPVNGHAVGPMGVTAPPDATSFGFPTPYQTVNEWESQKTSTVRNVNAARLPRDRNHENVRHRVPPPPPGYRKPTADIGNSREDGRDRTYFPINFPRPNYDSWTPRPLDMFRDPNRYKKRQDLSSLEENSDPQQSTRDDDVRNSLNRVNLQTEYFSLPATRHNSTARPTLRVSVKPSRIPVIVKKLGKRPKPKPSTSSDAPTTKRSVSLNQTDLCAVNKLECAVNGEVGNASSSNASFGQPLLDFLRGEVWVIPIIVASLALAVVLVIFEIYLLSKSVSANPSRRHLFLGQMLMLGLVLCCGMSVVASLKPSPVICSVLRIGVGLAYTIIYSTLLVKLVFLISLNSGVYLPATYQCLLLCFAILIQLVIGVQWLLSAPADAMEITVPDTGHVYQTCNVSFEQQLLGLLYVMFLVLVVVVLAFKSRGVRENYREAMYIGLTMHFTVCIFIVWILAGFFAPAQYQDVCMTCGIVGCAAITFVIMFMPKGRQLSAMGKEGVYAEDRADVYTGSSTQSTGSGGTPSPSFFPIKPGKLMQQYRDPLETPPTPRKESPSNQASVVEEELYSSLEEEVEGSSGRVHRSRRSSQPGKESEDTALSDSPTGPLKQSTRPCSNHARHHHKHHRPNCRLSGRSISDADNSSSRHEGRMSSPSFILGANSGLQQQLTYSVTPPARAVNHYQLGAKQSATNPNVMFRKGPATGLLY